MITNNLRFSGLASGIDTESLVKKLMDAEKAQLNKVLQNKTKTEWKVDAYRAVNTKFLDLRTSMENLRLESTFTKSKLTSSDSSKVDATLSGIPSRSEYIISSAKPFQPGMPSSVKFASTNIQSEISEFGAGNGFQFTLNGETIDLTAQDSIRSSITKINALAGKTGVTASYSSGDQAVIFTSKDAATDINIANVSNSTNGLKLAAGTVSGTQNDFATGNPSGATGNSGVKAVDGEVTINGTTLALKSNQLTYDGIVFNFKTSIPAGSNVTITKKPDVDAILGSIKGFVDKYNDTIKSLHDALGEKRFKDFTPLLDEQKKDMKDSEIELWEGKAKSGLLQSDQMISSALDKLRRTLYSKVSDIDPGKMNSQFDSLAEIGITSSSNYKDNGKLVIGETKLREALEKNMNEVALLFSKKYDTTDVKDNTVNNRAEFENSGIGWRLYDQLNETMKEISKTAGTSNEAYLAKSLRQIDTQIDSWEKRLQLKENYYWKQFTAMEQAIQKSNTQSSWLMQQMGGGM
ncbi:flagellar hook-associated protein 2 [Neobacillus bataviensis LMG 21833]|uniref:Flagellar hook-associated protein 2 n=1 Tax=Neobacillus bataviensis LMG 21833 TaxID=1117379 RepID=K6DSC6_9BACI|nr:flagellar filament capping protein FliD [Neobacillus bataviensis]EKN63691.1 flagellar hook-associated protein 2 [Neobacillus bataviensis LMG 21833]